MVRILPLAILLAWDAPLPPRSPASGYRVFWGASSGIYPNVTNVAETQVQLPVQSGFFRVQATNIWGQSLSDELYTPPSLTVISTLQQANELAGPWRSVASTTNNVPMTNGQGFVRVRVETR